MQNIWHFIILPTKSNPFQFIITYPIINPIIPYKEVEAPAFRPSGEIKIEKIFAPIPVTKYMIKVFKTPNVN